MHQHTIAQSRAYFFRLFACELSRNQPRFEKYREGDWWRIIVFFFFFFFRFCPGWAIAFFFSVSLVSFFHCLVSSSLLPLPYIVMERTFPLCVSQRWRLAFPDDRSMDARISVPPSRPWPGWWKWREWGDDSCLLPHHFFLSTRVVEMKRMRRWFLSLNITFSFYPGGGNRREWGDDSCLSLHYFFFPSLVHS